MVKKKNKKKNSCLHSFFHSGILRWLPEIGLLVIQLWSSIMHCHFEKTLKFIDIELPVFASSILCFCSTMKLILLQADPHGISSMTTNQLSGICQGFRILQMEILHLSFIADCGESFVKLDREGNTALLGVRSACVRNRRTTQSSRRNKDN